MMAWALMLLAFVVGFILGAFTGMRFCVDEEEEDDAVTIGEVKVNVEDV